MKRMIWGLLLSLFLVPQAFALNVADTTVVIPIIARAPGAPPSLWRTDVFIGNPYTPTAVITMKFYVSGGSMLQSTITLQPFNTATLPDIVLNTFGLTTGSGELELTCATSIEARANIYNAGSSVGNFGQAVPGLGKSTLRIQAYLYGLSGIDGNRCNIGVTNPNDFDLTVQLMVLDSSNHILHVRNVPLSPHQNVQYNDIFTTFGIAPQAGVIVQFTTGGDIGNVIYGYASMVRNDSGDPIFLFGTGPNV